MCLVRSWRCLLQRKRRLLRRVTLNWLSSSFQSSIRAAFPQVQIPPARPWQASCSELPSLSCLRQYQNVVKYFSTKPSHVEGSSACTNHPSLVQYPYAFCQLAVTSHPLATWHLMRSCQGEPCLHYSSSSTSLYAITCCCGAFSAPRCSITLSLQTSVSPTL